MISGLTHRITEAAFLLCLTCSGTTYYVDFTSGDDTAAGSSAGTAWKTIPGTRNSADSGYVSATYGGGTVSTSAKVQAGDVFLLTSGSVFTSAIGGKALIDSSYYVTTATLANPITFRRNVNAGAGSVIVDGAGAIIGGGGYGMWHIKVSGVIVDGAGTNGILFQNSPYDGISAYPSGDIEGPSVWDCTFNTNGTAYSAAENASDGQLRLLRSYGGTVTGCTFDGGGNMFQAIGMGDNGFRCTNYLVANCSAWNHAGVNDGGIAFKAQNSQVIWSNCVAWNNYKGWDAGEESSGGNRDTVKTWPIRYEVINCTSYSNNFGINFSGCGTDGNTRTNTDWYIINCLVYRNSENGSKIYAGPFNCYVVHSVYSSNASPNLSIGIDGGLDTNTINVYIYNTAFLSTSGTAEGNVSHFYWYDAATYHMTLYEDYNAYQQNATEYFKRFGHYGGGSDTHDFSYGANGPGHDSGTWYAFKSWSSDSHSKGTGCADTTLPPFNAAYIPTNSYGGLPLSGQSWYVTDMGKDRNGVSRSTWTIGAYEWSGAKASLAGNVSLSGNARIGQ